MVDAGVLVRTLELGQVMRDDSALAVVDGDRHAIDLGDDSGSIGEDHVCGVPCSAALDSGADVRGLGSDERYCLALHVGAHEGPVRIVVFEERDEGCRHRHDLLRGDVHQLDLLGRNVGDLSG